jgi:hypothetical protein
MLGTPPGPGGRQVAVLPAAPAKRPLRGVPCGVLFVAESLAVAGFVWLEADPHRRLVSLAFIFLATTAVLAGLVALGARVLARRTGRTTSVIVPALVARLWPLVLLDLVFLQFIVFLRDIRPVLPWLSILGSAYLLGVFISRAVLVVPRTKSRLDPHRRLPALFAGSFVAYALLASGLLLPPQPFSGDEPHYLLITQSLLADGDINLYNDYREEGYRSLYPGPLENHAFPGKGGPEHEYSRHLPGVSILVLPSYLAGKWAAKALAPEQGQAVLRARIVIFASRLTMCLLAAALGAAFFLLALRIIGREGPSLMAWAAFGFTSPLIYFSQLIYPEIPAALIAILVFLFVVLEKEPRPAALWLAGAGMGILPWFGIKYISISAVLFVFCLLSLPRIRGRVRAGLLSLSLPPAVSAGAYLCFFWNLYGTLSPTAAYGDAISSDHIAFASKSGPGLSEVLRFAFGYLFDQRFGIIPHSAVYILLFGGAVILWKRNQRAAVPLLVLCAVYWMQTAIVRIWGGYCPPGRLMLPILWGPALFMTAAFAAEKSRLRYAILAGATGLAFAAAFAGLSDPRLLYNENILTALSGTGAFNKLLASLSNSTIDFRRWVPSFANAEALKAPATAVWLFAAAAAAFVFARNGKGDGRPYRPFSPWAHAAVVLGLSLAVAGAAFFNVKIDIGSRADGVEILFQDGNTHGTEPGGFWTRGERGATVLIRASRRLSRISVALTSPIPGQTNVRAGMAERTVVRAGRNQPPATADFDAPVGFRRGDGYLYSLRVEDSGSFVPHLLDRQSVDGRTLGVFVSVSAR